MPAMLIRLIYASRSSGTLTPLDVKDIVQTSQRNNAGLGVTGALILSNGIFLQCLEGDHMAVNALYHRILLDPRHRDPAVLDLQEIDARQFGAWSMGLLANTEENRQLFLKYSPAAEFDPYRMGARALRGFFGEMLANVRWIG